MTIPVLIRVLWLMFDEEGDRLSGCFQHVFTLVSCKIPSSKQEIFFSMQCGQSRPPWCFFPLTPSLHSSCVFFPPLQVVFHVSSSESCFHAEERKQQ